MRVGVIRGDLSGPVFVADLEPVSRYNPPTEPRGQERYVTRPTVAGVEAVLADSTHGAGAVLDGSDISGSLPLTIDGTNDTLLLKTSSAASFTTVSIAHAAYASNATLIAAIQAGLDTAGLAITARENTAGTGIALEAAYGVDSYIENDTVVNGSIGNTNLGLADGAARTMVPAATLITDTLPVGGPLDVSSATITGSGATTATTALALIPTARGTVAALADVVAPQFIETPVALDSFLVGNLSGLLNAAFNPDSRRVPALTPGPAIEVVEDDGTTTFPLTLPTISGVAKDSPAPGDVTVSGTGLGSSEQESTTVKFTGDVVKTYSQAEIEAAGGSVSDTAVVVPASLVPGVASTTTSAQVKVRHRASAIVAVS